MRVLPRSVEAAIGRKLIKWGTQKELEKAGLVQESVYLPKSGVETHYFERNVPNASVTLVLCHGMTDKAEYMASFLNALNIPQNVRVLIPDAPGHGRDLERAQKLHPNEKFPHSSPEEMLSTMCELLDVLKVTKNCLVVGISMGGAMAYWLRQKRPDIIGKTVLIAPALEQCIDDNFIKDFETGQKKHHCFEERSELKQLFRDLSPPDRKKKDPVPKFFLQGIVEERKRTAPPSHYTEMMDTFLSERETDPALWSTTVDIDPDSPRLVLWPDHDFICNHDKGKAFFANSSPETTQFDTIDNCGHAFHANGQSVLLYVAPKVTEYLFGNEHEKESPLP